MRNEFLGFYILLICVLSLPDTINANALDTLAARQYLIAADSSFQNRIYKNVIAEGQKALDIYLEKLGENHLLTADAYAITGHGYSKLGNYVTALTYNEKALAIREKLEATASTDYTSILNVMAICQYGRGRLTEALVNFRKALEASIEIHGGDHESVGKYYNNIAICYANRGEYTKALTYYEKSKRVRLKHYKESDRKMILFYNNLGACYRSKGDLDKAIKITKKSLALCIDHYPASDPLLADTYEHLGEILRLDNQPQAALDAFNKTVRIARQTEASDAIRFGALYTAMATCYSDMDEPNRALDYYLKAKPILKKIYGKHRLVYQSLYKIGVLYTQKGDSKKAFQYLQKAQNIVFELYENESHHAVARGHLYIGQLMQRKEDLAQAIVAYDKGLVALGIEKSRQDLKKVTEKKLAIQLLASKIKVLNQQYKSDESIDNLHRANDLGDTAFELFDLAVTEYLGEGSKQNIVEDSYLLFDNAMLTYEYLHEEGFEGFQEKAFGIAEKGKSALLLQAVKDEDAKSFAGIPADLLIKEKELRTNIAFYEKQNFEEVEKGADGDQSLINELDQKIYDVTQAYEALVREFEQDYPAYYQLKYAVNQIDIKRLQKEILNEDRAILSYFLTENKRYTFVLTQDDLFMTTTKREADLEQRIVQWMHSISQYQEVKNRDLLDKLYVKFAYDLYEDLVLPVKENLKKELIIIPHDVLGYVPFDALLQALPSKAYAYRSHQYMVNDYQISYAHSVSLLEEMYDKDTATPSKKLLAFAPEFSTNDPIAFTRNLGNLSKNVDEVNAISQIILGDIYTRETATETQFCELAQDYKIIHLATHGIANDKAGDYCYLAFTEQLDTIENELLYAKELYHLQLNADMIVLSACETATGEMQKGEGIVSLARSFSYAGAKSIITTLWSINDATTSELMQTFYTNIKNAETKDAALRNAKLTYLSESRNDMAHPVYWAAFIPLGNMEIIDLNTSKLPFLLLIIALLASIAAFTNWWYKK